MRRRSSIFGNLDPFIIILYFLLVIIGWANLYATTFTETASKPSYMMQLFAIGMALVAALFILLIDAKFYESFAYIIYGVFTFLLLAVLVVGTSHKGAKSWINLGFANIQPSEYIKFAIALALAKYFGDKKSIKPDSLDGVFKMVFYPLIFIIPPTILIALQPDLGSAIVFIAFYIALFREGFPGWILGVVLLTLVLFLLTLYLQTFSFNITLLNITLLPETNSLYGFMAIVPGILYFIVNIISKKKTAFIRKALITLSISLVVIGYMGSITYIFNSNLLEPRHRDRINETLGITHDPSGIGYNVNQSKIAIGSGGLLGKGFLKGTQTKYDFVPEQRTDFIFCTIGEEFGFLGTTVVILIYLLFIITILNAAERQKAVFSRIYGYCVACLFFIHFVVNIGMTIGLVPVIGIPLPFFSYGGSSMIAFTMLLFIFIKLDSEKKFILS